jgi:hypothetical protein
MVENEFVKKLFYRANAMPANSTQATDDLERVAVIEDVQFFIELSL